MTCGGRPRRAYANPKQKANLIQGGATQATHDLCFTHEVSELPQSTSGFLSIASVVIWQIRGLSRSRHRLRFCPDVSTGRFMAHCALRSQKIKYGLLAAETLHKKMWTFFDSLCTLMNQARE